MRRSNGQGVVVPYDDADDHRELQLALVSQSRSEETQSIIDGGE